MKQLSSKVLSALTLAVLGANAVSVRQSTYDKVVGTVELTIENGDFSGGKPKEAYVQFKGLDATLYRTKTTKIADAKNAQFTGEPKAFGT